VCAGGLLQLPAGQGGAKGEGGCGERQRGWGGSRHSMVHALCCPQRPSMVTELFVQEGGEEEGG
jgi:hypothetical protein